MNKKTKKLIISILALTILCQYTVPGIADSTTMQTIRAESDAETAIAIAKELNSQSDIYVITTTDNYPDALAGTVLAGKYNAPIFFVSKDNNQKIFDYLASKNANQNTHFYILGGTGAVSTQVEDSLKAISSKVVRLGGLTRYDTANIINDCLDVKEGTNVIIATGENYPDALSMGAVGGQLQYPIYLVEGNSIYPNTVMQLQKIKPDVVYIAGGTAVVPTAIENQIMNLLLATTIVRLGGLDRYETSAKIADCFQPYFNETIYTTGKDYHAALVSAPLAVQHKASITLIDNITPEYQTSMDQKTGYIVGNIDVISPQKPQGEQVTQLSEADIQRLQSYPQYSGGGSYVSFQDMQSRRESPYFV